MKIKSTKFYRNLLTKTVGDFLLKYNGVRFRETTQIRENARELWRKLELPDYCELCGYSKYYELCHIKPISYFSPEDKIILVNSPSNLIALCPNHHKELDKELMDASDLIKIKNICQYRAKPYIGKV
ncbi:MAG: hypothetical protein Phog2KO_23600 [Phototrophicaceae bacterium]